MHFWSAADRKPLRRDGDDEGDSGDWFEFIHFQEIWDSFGS